MEIRAKARRLKAQHGDLGLIVIDYLQLMSGGGNAENRQLEVSEISRNLKILARELEVPIVALSQLSRNLEAARDKRPMLSDLRESGSARTGRRRRDVPVPRRGLQQGVARPRARPRSSSPSTAPGRRVRCAWCSSGSTPASTMPRPAGWPDPSIGLGSVRADPKDHAASKVSDTCSLAPADRGATPPRPPSGLAGISLVMTQLPCPFGRW